ncbi:MAG: molecular chaperone DnaK [Blastocatellia bacterium]|nr:MAG: molecular chaperone DnaK [Blastocatellia bacterium]
MDHTPFLVGIDLGTTNSTVAALDTRHESAVRVIPLPQLTAHSTVEPRSALPSFLYFPERHEIEAGQWAVPWAPTPDWVAGVLARDYGSLTPARQIVSAKSWLAHGGVDRRSILLPWDCEAPARRMSPVAASAAYLSHIRDAWNVTIAATDDGLRLERQSVVLTVPASFDEEARELTVEAARAAQLAGLTLLEEPIAAFYAWSARHDIGDLTGAAEQIALVCDVGGGTTDFSLIRVRRGNGQPAFERIAIGDHLLLGGDNVDLALALVVEQKINAESGNRLTVPQRQTLRRQCSAAKESLLGENAPSEASITLLGSGRAVVGDAIKTVLTRDEVNRTLETFLPLTAAGDAQVARPARAALRELGLPYQNDPAITRHLAAFLARSASLLDEGHRAVVRAGGHSMIRPDCVLFNGGFFMPSAARDRVVEALAGWFGSPPGVLPSTSLDAAVALGAAHYAQIRAGIDHTAPLIKAGSGRTYYIALNTPRAGDSITAVCVLPRGTDEGTHFTLDHPFTVATNTPVAFSLFSSTIRRDEVGQIVKLQAADVHEHAPLVTVLRYGRKSRGLELPIRLSIAFTELGTLEFLCESLASDHRWRLQFELRGSTETVDAGQHEFDNSQMSPADAESTAGHEAIVPQDALDSGEAAVRAVFSGRGADTPEQLVAVLEQRFGYAKTSWPIGALRYLSDVLIDVADRRRLSPPLEARWLNLFGFCLRPGFGAAKDPWRVTEARKIYSAGVVFPSAVQNRAEWVVLWQRVAGGFSTGQQLELARRTMGDLGMGTKKARGLTPQIERESWRLLASLERVDATARAKIGDELLARLAREPTNASLLWAIGRLGARVPLYGPLNSVVPPVDAGRWLRRLASFKHVTPEMAAALVHIGALTGDPLRDVDEETLAAVRERLTSIRIDSAATRPLREILPPSSTDTNWVFGEPLPNGLRLRDESAEHSAIRR